MGRSDDGRGANVVPGVNGGFMSAEITSVAPVVGAQPHGASADDRGSLGTLCWARAVKVAGLAAAVAALLATSVVASHMTRVVGPPAQARYTSVVSPQRAAAEVP